MGKVDGGSPGLATIDSPLRLVPHAIAGYPGVPALVRMSEGGRLTIVGESHYQQNLREIAGGRAFGYELADHLPVLAVLVPEVANVFDPHAVRVDLFQDGDGLATVGHLARQDARRYWPTLNRLRQRGCFGTCPGRVCGGGNKYYGVYLHIGPPHALFKHSSQEVPT